MSTWVKRVIYYFLGLGFALLILFVVKHPPTHTQIIACDVGQGDAILIIKGSNQVLIDGGPSDSKILDCLADHLPFWDRTLELVAFTNTDIDHLGGLSAVLPRYHIGKLVGGDGIGASDGLSRFVSVLKDTSLVVTPISQGDTLKVGTRNPLTFKVLWPDTVNLAAMAAFDPGLSSVERSQVLGMGIVKNVNERSIVLLLEEKSYRALFTGDIGFATETTLLGKNLLPKLDFLKVGHHGGKYSTGTAFLSITKPTLAVISVGKDNRYGHPTSEALTSLKNIGAKVLRTDQIGDVVTTIP